MTVWFDVEDLFHYASEVGGRTTGIQRLTLEIYRALDGIAGGTGEIGFLRHGAGPIPFKPVSWDAIAAQFVAQSEDEPPEELLERDLPEPEDDGRGPEETRSGLRRAARSWMERIPEHVRRPLVLAAVLQMQAAGQIGRFGLSLLSAPPLPPTSLGVAAQAPAPAPVPAPVPERDPVPDHVLRPGDVLLALGSPWFRSNYGALARWLRDEKRMRFGVLMHDLVPIRHPQWTDVGTMRAFKAWYSEVLPFCDIVLANSRFTAADVEAYLREKRIALPRPVHPVPIGTGFGPPELVQRAIRSYDKHPEPGTYVLFVSTLEARKNHALAVRMWTRLVADVRAGRRSPESVPVLVFAGRIGWLVRDVVQQLENTDWLDGWVRLVQSPTDPELRALYAGCLFSFYPSLHEGWGLPVTESLAAGKPCLCSNAASLPEAGGGLCRYFDPEDTEGAYRAVIDILDDRPVLARWEAQVRREFKPVPWSETARAVLEAAAGASALSDRVGSLV